MLKAMYIRYNASHLPPKDGCVTRIAKKVTLTKKQSDTLNQIIMSRTHRLDHVEIWFGVLTNKLLKRLSSNSTDELKDKILSFVAYFNDTMAKAFKWTYKGKILNA